MRTLLLAAATVLSATALCAQTPVSVVGRVEPAGTPPACDPTATHRLRDTPVFLRSALVDLNTVGAGSVRIVGTVADLSCPVIDVVSSSPSPISLSVCNATALGCPVTLDLCPAPVGSAYAIAVSTGTSFVPIDPVLGSLLIDPAGLQIIAVGAIGAICQSTPITMPTAPAAIGKQVPLQAIAVGPTTQILSNVHVVTVQPPSVPCTNFVCF